MFNTAYMFKLRVGCLKPSAYVKIIIEYITEVKNEPGTSNIRFYVPNALQPSLSDIKLEWEGLVSDTVPEQPTPVLNKTKTLLGYNKPIESDSLTITESRPKIRQSPKIIPPVYDGSQLLVFGLFQNECPKYVLIRAQSPDGPLTVKVEVIQSVFLKSIIRINGKTL